MYQAIDNILSTAGNASSRLFCPFCVDFFEYKFTLMDHLQRFHNASLLQASHQLLPLKECPFCRAKFYGKHLITKHTLQYHSKVVMQLYTDHKQYFQCMFCTLNFREKSHSNFAQHIEEQHFSAFDQIFQEQFCNLSPGMKSSHHIDSIISDKEELNSSSDFSVNVDPLSSRKDFIESSKMICFDLTDLKQQLENIKDSGSVKKSILKSPRPCLVEIGNTSFHQNSARRVLRFDLPDCSEDKENSVLAQNLKINGVTLDEQSLLCTNEKQTEFVDNSCGDFALEEPKYCSTPNAPNALKVKKKIQVKKSSSFKSYITKKKGSSDFSFKCGKCALMFEENIELVCHMKKYHNKLTSNLLQPCYQCAICNAKFFKNRYLEKHHRFHYYYQQSYKKSIFY